MLIPRIPKQPTGVTVMDYKDILSLIEEGEGFEIEFKRKVSSPEKIARTMIAFANTKGGHLLFGVDDDGSIIGVESEKSEVNLIGEAGSLFCEPAITPEIDIVPFNGKDVIAAYVRESSEKPHYFTGENGNGGDHTRVYVRVHDKTVTASKEVVRILRAERPDAPPIHLEIGENEKRLFSYLNENERITTKEFSKLVNISDQRATRILVALVRAGVMRIHTLEKCDYFTLAYDVSKPSS
jgi:predicted HTH transcriptional regulator